MTFSVPLNLEPHCHHTTTASVTFARPVQMKFGLTVVVRINRVGPRSLDVIAPRTTAPTLRVAGPGMSILNKTPDVRIGGVRKFGSVFLSQRFEPPNPNQDRTSASSTCRYFPRYFQTAPKSEPKMQAGVSTITDDQSGSKPRTDAQDFTNTNSHEEFWPDVPKLIHVSQCFLLGVIRQTRAPTCKIS